jgi:hypothetical protein
MKPRAEYLRAQKSRKIQEEENFSMSPVLVCRHDLPLPRVLAE